MKVKVLKTFTDKHNRALLHEKGTELEVNKTRFDEINSTEHGKLVEEVKETKKKK